METAVTRETTFAERVSLLAEAEGSSSALARGVGVSEGAVRNWMKGKEPARDSLLALARYTGVSLEWLVSGEGPMRRSTGREAEASPLQHGDPGAALEADILRQRLVATEARVRELERDVERLTAALRRLREDEDARLVASLGGAPSALEIRGSALHGVWSLLDVLSRHHPRGLSLEEILAQQEKYGEMASSQDVRRDLTLLEQRGLLERDCVGFRLAKPYSELRLVDPRGVDEHVKVAMRIFLQGVLPAVQKRDGRGVLFSAGAAIDGRTGRETRARILDAVRAECGKISDTSGDEELTCVLGIVVSS